MCKSMNMNIPYQELLSFQNKSKLAGENKQLTIINKDRFDNEFAKIKFNLSQNEKFLVSNTYELKINNIDFKNIKEVSMEDYNKNDNVFKLYCNENDEYYQGSDSRLINLSNYIIGDETNPIKIAHKIITWISDNIEYGLIYPNDDDNFLYYYDRDIYGALKTYIFKKGKCWDFSELMVTLLRIQGIPARNVIGLALQEKGKEPKRGDTYGIFWKFYKFLKRRIKDVVFQNMIYYLTFKDKIFNFYNLFQINFVGILKKNNFLYSSGK